MTRSQRFFLLACIVVCLVCFSSAAQGAEEGAATAGRATEIFKWINFAIVAGAILWLFGIVLPPKFRQNAAKISSAITSAAATRAAADAQLREAENKLSRLSPEVDELRAFAKREGAGEAGRIRALAQSDSEKIFLAAKAEIEAAERAARLELKAFAAKLAVDGAESLLAKQLTAQTQDALVGAFVKSLEGGPN